MKTRREDHTQQRAWGETSGKMTHVMKKLGSPVIKPSEVSRLTGKQITPDTDGNHYMRDIGGTPHRKIAFGFPKETK